MMSSNKAKHAAQALFTGGRDALELLGISPVFEDSALTRPSLFSYREEPRQDRAKSKVISGVPNALIPRARPVPARRRPTREYMNFKKQASEKEVAHDENFQPDDSRGITNRTAFTLRNGGRDGREDAGTPPACSSASPLFPAGSLTRRWRVLKLIDWGFFKAR